MKNAHYDNQPSKFEAAGDGSFRYRWDIEPEIVITETEEGPVSKTVWKCFEVTVWGTVRRESLTQAVIEMLWGNGVEEKLLNDYNAAQLGILDNSYIQAYTDFLIQRKSIKEKVRLDCEELKIY